MKYSRPDFIINAAGEQFNASDFGYPFFFYEGTYYQSDKHQGHNVFFRDLAEKMGWPQDDVFRKKVNDRKGQTTGRVFPEMESFGGKTVVTIWSPLTKSKDIIKGITDGIKNHFCVQQSDLLFHAGKNEFVDYDKFMALLRSSCNQPFEP